VRCERAAADAHHVLERRLWPDGGYYLDNGASLCAEHHLMAETTEISVGALREWCDLRPLLPEHLYEDQAYDKWGNPILHNGLRARGELFADESVQKVLAPVLDLFTNRVKYPRTYHLPFSPGVTSDDRMLSDYSHLLGPDVVVTVKMDGECTTLYRDGLHARSAEYTPHPSRALHARIAYEIPETWRICGENLYARHSIAYQDLPSYFMVFSIWDGLRCLSWDETVEWSTMLGLHTVPVLYRGTEPPLKALCGSPPGTLGEYGGNEMEGWVIRLADSFPLGTFRRSVAKYVRADHVRTHGHWMRSAVVANGLQQGT